MAHCGLGRASAPCLPSAQAERLSRIFLWPFLAQTEPKVLLEGVRAALPALNPDAYISNQAMAGPSEILGQAGLLTKPVPFAVILTNE